MKIYQLKATKISKKRHSNAIYEKKKCHFDATSYFINVISSHWQIFAVRHCYYKISYLVGFNARKDTWNEITNKINDKKN